MRPTVIIYYIVTLAGTGFHLAVGFVSAVGAPPTPPLVAAAFLVTAAVASVPGDGPVLGAAGLVVVGTGTAAFTSGCCSLPPVVGFGGSALLLLSAAADVEPGAEFFAIASNGSIVLAALEVLLLLEPFALLLLLLGLGLPAWFTIGTGGEAVAASGTVFTWKLRNREEIRVRKNVGNLIHLLNSRGFG